MENKKCDLCEKSFLFETTLKLHRRKIHEDGLEEDIKTSAIGKGRKEITFSVSKLAESQNVKKKNDVHKNKNVENTTTQVQICKNCSFKTSDSSLYWAHVLVEHSPIPSQVFYCGYNSCWFPFISLREKEAHEVTNHGALHLPFKCLLCKKSLVTKSALEQHKILCIRKPFYKCPCPPCDFQSNRFGQLSKHAERIHHKDLLLVDKSTYTFHHKGFEKSSDCDLSTESEDVKSEEEAGTSNSICYVGNRAPVHGSTNNRECKPKDDIKSDEEEEIVLAGVPQTAPAPAPSPPFQCPYDKKHFPNWLHLHKHLHSSHLETGTDMVDCPLGKDTLACICGRKTNCRDTLVVHCIRCFANMGEVVEGEKRRDDDDEDNLEKGWLVARRRARKKCRELGLNIEDEPSKTEKRMLDMCRKVSARELDMTGKKENKTVVSKNNAVVELSDDDDGGNSSSETTGTSFFLSPTKIAPAKRKSVLASKVIKSKNSSLPKKKSQKKPVVLSSSEENSGSEVEADASISSIQNKVKCHICEKTFDENVIMEHFCDYDVNEKEVLMISSGSEIDISEEDDSTANTYSEATSEEEIPIKTNVDMLAMLENLRKSPTKDHKQNPNVVQFPTSGIRFDLTYSLPPSSGTPSPSSMMRLQGNKRTRAKLKSRGRKGYVPTKKKHGLQFKK